MKQIYVNLKRFDITPEKGGVNRIAPMAQWGESIVSAIQKPLEAYAGRAECVLYLPEAHLLAAGAAINGKAPLGLGCQGVYRQDTAPKGNFGAFTTNRPAHAAALLGCKSAIIGHCEERLDKAGILAEAGVDSPAAVNRILNQEVLAAQRAGLHVLYCVGETSEERPRWQEVLENQLETGLAGAAMKGVSIAYEPVWSIGPGKTPPDRECIQMVANFIKAKTNGAKLVYGGGLKEENAAMLASIAEMDGGLVALTRFTGEIGFYPEEFLRIVEVYIEAAEQEGQHETGV